MSVRLVQFGGERAPRYLSLVLALLVCWSYPQLANSALSTVPTTAGNGADLDVQEYFDAPGPVTDTGDGDDDEANSRFNPGSFRNEFIVLRFDISGADKSKIVAAAVNMITYRGSNNDKDQRIWGVNSGVANLNTFDENTTVFSTTPGLNWDNNPTTQGVIDADTTFLGNFTFNDAPDPGEGETLVINQQLLNQAPADPDGLVAEATIDQFLQSLGPTDQAVFLIGGAGTSNGQLRITTKESTSTAGGVLTGDLGDLAPTLTWIPEPTSAMLLVLGGLGLGMLRRRAR